MNIRSRFSAIGSMLANWWHWLTSVNFRLPEISLPGVDSLLEPPSGEIDPQAWPPLPESESNATASPFDCLHKLKPGEPYFVLRAQDATASNIVRQWIAIQKRNRTCSPEKIADAERIASAMDEYPHSRKPD